MIKLVVFDLLFTVTVQLCYKKPHLKQNFGLDSAFRNSFKNVTNHMHAFLRQLEDREAGKEIGLGMTVAATMRVIEKNYTSIFKTSIGM